MLLEQPEQTHIACLEKDLPFGKEYHGGHLSLSLVAKHTLKRSYLLHSNTVSDIAQDTKKNTIGWG